MRRFTGVALTLFLAASASASQDVIRKGFTVADGGTLVLDGGYGNIRVVTGGTGVAIEVTREADGRQGEKRMAAHKITFNQRGNDVVITSDDDRDDHSWFRGWDDNDYEVQWNIRVPDRYNVKVETSGGRIELDDIGGTVDARTSGGNIKTGRLAGVSVLKTSGGNITVAGAAAKLDAHTSGGSINIGDTDGPLEAKTSGGSITLARINGDVRAHTSGGSIKIEDAAGAVDATTSGGSITATLSRQPRGDSRLSTSGGGVTVHLAPSIAVDLDARASGGGVVSAVPITIQGTQDDDSLRGEVNGGGPKLTLRTSGGGIRVKAL
jgi:hypothetical protein